MKWGPFLGGLALGISLSVAAFALLGPWIWAHNTQQAFEDAVAAGDHRLACEAGQFAALAWRLAGDEQKELRLRGSAAVSCLKVL
jgi:hypothetical protein